MPIVFAGRLHPRAMSLNLALNGATPTHFYQNRVYPELILTDIPVTGDTAAAPLPEKVAPEATIDHPAGITITLHQISFSDIDHQRKTSPSSTPEPKRSIWQLPRPK